MKVPFRLLAVTLSLVLSMSILAGPFPIPTFSQSPDTHSLDLFSSPDFGTEKNPKLDSALNELVNHPDSALSVSGLSGQSEAGEPTIRVVVESQPGFENTVSEISGRLGTVESEYNGLLQVNLPVSAIAGLAANENIRFVRLPYQAFPDVISEGVSVINASEWQSRGFDGKGVKIGILDGGFSGLQTLQSQGELPTNITIWQSPSLGWPGTENHGAACAEIIYDIAPGATYYFANFSGDVEYGNAVDWMVSQGVNIISCSVGWPGVGSGDGLGPIDQIVDRAANAGILWCQSAGNYAQRHWSGSFVSADGDIWLDFSPGDETNVINAVAGQSITISLSWNDPWGLSSNDYDLYLLDQGLNIVSYSESQQSGNGYPFEFINYKATYTGTYAIAVAKYHNAAVRTFHLYSYNHNLYYSVVAGSLSAPADSINALTVGAVPYNSPGSIEPFSSQGPNTAGVVKPDIVAPDGVSTVTYGTSGFYGTSAAAPCAAGAAALTKQSFPNYSSSQIQYYLESHAVDLGTTGKDNVFGSGRLTLPLISLKFMTNAQSITAGAVSNIITVQTQDSSGSPVILTTNTDINLTSSSFTGKFDTSSGGPFNGTLNKVTISSGSSTASFYYQDTTSGSPNLSASAAGFGTGTQQETVTPGPATQINIETDANGTGAVIPAQNLTAGSSLTAYAITRDQYGNLVSKVAGTWSLGNKSNGVVDADLVPASDSKSAVLSAHLVGTAKIHVAVSGLPPADSGTITVIPSTKNKLIWGTQPPSTTTAGAVWPGFTIKITDAYGNQTADTNAVTIVPSSGTLGGTLTQNAVGGLATFNNISRTQAGALTLTATSGNLTAAPASNTISITHSTPTQLSIESAADGSGTLITARNLTAGSSLTSYAIARDQYGNLVSNVAGTWSLGNKSNGVVDADLVPASDSKSAVLSAHLVGTAKIHVAVAGLPAADSGTITVIPSTKNKLIWGTQPPSTTTAGAVWPGFTIKITDAYGNQTADTNAVTIVPSSGTLGGTLTQNAVGGLATFNNISRTQAGDLTLTATSGNLTAAPASNTISITHSTPTQLSIESAADDSGTLITARNLTAGSSLTSYAIARDQYNNFVSNVAGTWSLGNKSNGVVDADLAPASDSKSAVLSAHLVGTAKIHVAVAGLPAADSGTITVIPSTPTQLSIESTADGSGTLITARNLTAGSSLNVYAITRDQYNNFVSNVAGTWTLANTNGEVYNSDLVTSPDGKSATFTAHLPGSAKIHLTSGSFPAADSGLLTVGLKLIVSGYPSSSTAGDSHAFTVNASDGYNDTVTTYSGTIRFTISDSQSALLPDYTFVSGDHGTHSFNVTLKTAGTQSITATDIITAETTGSQTGIVISPASASQIKIETGGDAGGTPVTTRNVSAGSPFTVYANAHDDFNNFVANVPGTWTLANISAGVVDADLMAAADGKSATFTGHLVGSAKVNVASAGLANATCILRVDPSVKNKLAWGTQPPASVIAGDVWTAFTVEVADQFGNQTDDTDAVSVVPSSGTLDGILIQNASAGLATFNDITYTQAGTLTLTASSGTLTAAPASNVITVNPAAATQVKVESAASGNKGALSAQTVNSGSSITVYAITYDKYNNLVTNAAGTWYLANKSAGVVDADLVPASDGKSAVFTGHQAGTAIICAAITGLDSFNSGVITVVANGGGGGGGGGGAPVSQYNTVKLTGLTTTGSFKVDSSGKVQNAVQIKTTNGQVVFDIVNGAKLKKDKFDPVYILTADVLDAPPAAPDQQALVMAYNFGPEGATFDPGMTLTLKYDATKLPRGVAEKDLYIAFWDGKQWQSLTGTIDTVNHTVSVTLTHFSYYALMGQIVEPTPTPTLTPTPVSMPTPTATPTVTPAPLSTPQSAANPDSTNTPVVPNTSSETLSPSAPTGTGQSPQTPNNWLIIGVIVAVAAVAVICLLAIWTRTRKAPKN